MKIAVAGTGYVGLSLAVLLAQNNRVYAVDIVPEKVEMINNRKSPIQDDYIERYLVEKVLDLTATLNAQRKLTLTLILLLLRFRQIMTARKISLIHRQLKM